MAPLPITIADASIQPGEAYLAETPLLREHAGTQPDLFLRWNKIPITAAQIDVVVHLHGFSQQGAAMPLSEKAARSGFDLSGRVRPTLAVLPRGNWMRHYWYDFPALLSGGIDTLIGYALARFAEPPPERDGFAIGRFILSAHSGGVMPALDAVAGAARAPDELYLFDGLYGRDPSLGDPMDGLDIIDRWLAVRLAAEPERPGALRVVYIERQTGPMSREVARLVQQRLAAACPATAGGLARRYRVEPAGVPHGYIASVCLPQLLADSGVEFDWSRV